MINIWLHVYENFISLQNDHDIGNKRIYKHWKEESEFDSKIYIENISLQI